MSSRDALGLAQHLANVFGKAARQVVPPEFQAPSVGAIRSFVARTGYFRLRTQMAAHGQIIPEAHLYQPLYSPWLGAPEFERVYKSAAGRTLVSRDRCYVLWQTLQQASRLDGSLAEFGVFRGGTAILAAATVRETGMDRPLHLVDSFAGMPDTVESIDRFRKGDLSSASADDVRRALSEYPFATVHEGFIPDVLGKLKTDRIAWAHVDVDIYEAVRDCLEYLYPRLCSGAMVVHDDYGFPSCPGARRAVDEFYLDRPEIPLCLPTGQCLVVKLP